MYENKDDILHKYENYFQIIKLTLLFHLKKSMQFDLWHVSFLLLNERAFVYSLQMGRISE